MDGQRTMHGQTHGRSDGRTENISSLIGGSKNSWPLSTPNLQRESSDVEAGIQPKTGGDMGAQC